MYYILEGKEPKEVDPYQWAIQFDTSNRHVAQDEIADGVKVSTVFLGLDHQYGDGPPLLFETLVFEGTLDGEMMRYSTWEEAEIGHKEMVERVRLTFANERSVVE